MKLRKSINTPVRYDEYLMDADKPRPTKPAFPKKLQSTVIPYNPNARPAAFPSLSLATCASPNILNDSTNHESGFVGSAPRGFWPSLTQPGADLEQRSTFDKSGAEGEQERLYRSFPLSDHDPISAQPSSRHMQGSASPFNVNDFGEPLVKWHMLDLPMQVYLYSDLIIQLSSPNKVAEWLGLSIEDLIEVQRAHRMRQIHPATTEQLWDYCVSVNPNAEYIEPNLLAEYLDYCAYASQYEYASTHQIILARTFLRQHNIDPSILDETLRQDGLWIRPHIAFDNTYDHAKPCSTQVTSAESVHARGDNTGSFFVSPGRHDRQPSLLRSSRDIVQFAIRLDSVTGRAEVIEQPTPTTGPRIPAMGAGISQDFLHISMHKLHDPAKFARHFRCQYFPSHMRDHLLAKSPASMTDLQHWLAYGTSVTLEPRKTYDMLQSQSPSLRALIYLHNRFSSTIPCETRDETLLLASFENLALLWLYIVVKGMVLTYHVWSKVHCARFTNRQQKRYQQTAGFYARKLLLKEYEAIRLAYVENLQHGGTSRPQDNAIYASGRTMNDNIQCRGNGLDECSRNDVKDTSSTGRNEISIPLTLRIQPNRLTQLEQKFLGIDEERIAGVSFRRSPPQPDLKPRSDTVSTDATLDIEGINIRYQRYQMEQEDKNADCENQTPFVQQVPFPDAWARQEQRALESPGTPRTSDPDRSFEDNNIFPSHPTETYPAAQTTSPIAPPYSPINLQDGARLEHVTSQNASIGTLPRKRYLISSSILNNSRETPWKRGAARSASGPPFQKENRSQDKSLVSRFERLSGDENAARTPKRLKLMFNGVGSGKQEKEDYFISESDDGTHAKLLHPLKSRSNKQLNTVDQNDEPCKLNESDAAAEMCRRTRSCTTDRQTEMPTTPPQPIMTANLQPVIREARAAARISRSGVQETEDQLITSDESREASANTPTVPKSARKLRKDKGVKRGPYKTKCRKEKEDMAGSLQDKQ